MKKPLLFITITVLCGCSPLEMVKSIWGSSTRRLDLERANAVSHTYSCKFDECFDGVLDIARKSEENTDSSTAVKEPADDAVQFGVVSKNATEKFEVFLQDRTKGVIVVMKVPGNVDTTEVGIFFSRVRSNETTIEVTSLSTSAKRKVADFIHEALSERYP